MKIGSVLNIEAEDVMTREIIKYRCKLIEKKKKYLLVDYPINVKTNKTAFLVKGTTITVSYVKNSTAVYQFKSKVVKHIKSKVPALAIVLPEESEIKRVQRRGFVRVDTAVDVALHPIEEKKFDPITTVTSDISGGGLSVIISVDSPVVIGDKIESWIVLPMQAGDYHYIKASAEVVYIKELKNRIHTASLKFTDIDSKSQQSIVKYCFEKQREARQKELI